MNETLPYTVHNASFTISTDPARLDLDVIHGYLYHCYWSPGIPRELVAKAIEHSLCFGLYQVDTISGHQQIGFSRVVTDYASFAYLADVFVLADYRRQGLGVWLVESILAHPALQDLRSFSLATRDAQELYRRFGFTEVDSAHYMIKRYDLAWRQPDLVRD